MVKANFGHTALQDTQPGPSFLCEDLPAPRRCLDVSRAANPSHLAADRDRVADVFEEVRADDEIEELIGIRPG